MPRAPLLPQSSLPTLQSWQPNPLDPFNDPDTLQGLPYIASRWAVSLVQMEMGSVHPRSQLPHFGKHRKCWSSSSSEAPCLSLFIQMRRRACGKFTERLLLSGGLCRSNKAVSNWFTHEIIPFGYKIFCVSVARQCNILGLFCS